MQILTFIICVCNIYSSVFDLWLLLRLTLCHELKYLYFAHYVFAMLSLARNLARQRSQVQDTRICQRTQVK